MKAGDKVVFRTRGKFPRLIVTEIHERFISGWCTNHGKRIQHHRLSLVDNKPSGVPFGNPHDYLAGITPVNKAGLFALAATLNISLADIAEGMKILDGLKRIVRECEE